MDNRLIKSIIEENESGKNEEGVFLVEDVMSMRELRPDGSCGLAGSSRSCG